MRSSATANTTTANITTVNIANAVKDKRCEGAGWCKGQTARDGGRGPTLPGGAPLDRECRPGEYSQHNYSNAHPDSILASFASPRETISVVDERMCLLPPGLSGEIVIGSACIAAGDLSHAYLTKQSFVQNILAKDQDIQSGWTTTGTRCLTTSRMNIFQATGACLLKDVLAEMVRSNFAGCE
ncbi:hypothetical protein F4679DRAFT_407346 [Xylaria curta]|nr:hypothetical protein F4679DRAFT_407346 [Xylaria curta]